MSRNQIKEGGASKVVHQIDEGKPGAAGKE